VHEAVLEMRLDERRLRDDYRAWLRRPLKICRYPLPTGETLESDAVDAAENELIEAMCSTARSHIRMALGQLLDYRRFHTPSPTLGLLVPKRPSDDLLDLVHEFGVHVVWPDDAGFSRLPPPPKPAR